MQAPKAPKRPGGIAYGASQGLEGSPRYPEIFYFRTVHLCIYVVYPHGPQNAPQTPSQTDSKRSYADANEHRMFARWILGSTSKLHP